MSCSRQVLGKISLLESEQLRENESHREVTYGREREGVESRLKRNIQRNRKERERGRGLVRWMNRELERSKESLEGLGLCSFRVKMKAGY